MSCERNMAVLIPAYRPGGALPDMAARLKELGFFVCVVNDGSGEEYDELFRRTAESAVIISHENNMGKGAALKTGICYLSEYVPRLKGFITADADGQHSLGDIVKVAKKLEESEGIVLGIRNLEGDVPARSRFGNSLSRVTYSLVSGRYLTDNQAGLRGFHMELGSFLTGIAGRYYEYEMNVLVHAAQEGIKINTVPIETIYLEGNSGSNFQPVKDTVRIQWCIIKNGLPSIIMYMLAAAAGIAGALAGLNLWMSEAAVAVLCAGHLVQKRKTDGFIKFFIVVKYMLFGGAAAGLKYTKNGWIAVAAFVLAAAVTYLSARVRYR